MQPIALTLAQFAKIASKSPTYSTVRDFLETTHPEWIRALIPRIINASAQYWPQKVLAVAAIEAALCNQIATQHGLPLDHAFTAVEGQMGHLLQYQVPTFYVSQKFLTAASRTELPMDLPLQAIPFPFPAILFMFPKGTLRHATAGECPFIAISRQTTGQTYTLPLKGARFGVTAPEDSVIATTYLPEENCCYQKTISLIDDETIKQAFERASKAPYDIPEANLHDRADTSIEVHTHFIDRLWLLGLTLVLIMASGERLIEYGARLKVVKSKSPSQEQKEFWSPNYLGRVYTPVTSPTWPDDTESHLVQHWRKGHIKSQPYGPRHSLRKLKWLQPYRAGRGPSSKA